MSRDVEARLAAFMAIEEQLHEVIGATASLNILMDALGDSHVEREDGVKRLVILQDVDSAVQWGWTKLYGALNKATAAWYAAAAMPIDTAAERGSGVNSHVAHQDG